MMRDTNKLLQIISKLSRQSCAPTPEMDLRDDLGFDSAGLIELTVVVHNELGVDLGRAAVQRQIDVVTVADVISLLPGIADESIFAVE